MFNGIKRNFSKNKEILTPDMIGMSIKGVTLSDTPLSTFVGRNIGKLPYIVTDLVVVKVEREQIEALFGHRIDSPHVICVEVYVDGDYYTTYPSFEIANVYL